MSSNMATYLLKLSTKIASQHKISIIVFILYMACGFMCNCTNIKECIWSSSSSSWTSSSSTSFVHLFWHDALSILLQLQNSMQDNWADVHPHRDVEHGLSVEHPHLIIFNISCGAASTSPGTGTGDKVLEDSFLVHPNLIHSCTWHAILSRDWV